MVRTDDALTFGAEPSTMEEGGVILEALVEEGVEVGILVNKCVW